MAKSRDVSMRASAGASAANVKVTMALPKPDLDTVATLRRQLGKETRSVTVASALDIAATVVSKLEAGCESYETHRDGTWSKLELLGVA